MKLKVDKKPKVGPLEFFTLKKDYVTSSSPRSITMQRGLEFDHFRSYQHGDDARLIDWKASARADEVLVRVYSMDISMNILIMIDVSESMIYGTGEKAKIEFAFELASNLSYGTLAYGDRVGMLLFNERIAASVPFGSGLEHFSVIIDLFNHSKNFGGGVNLQLALSNALALFKGVHLVIMITDFLGFGSSFYTDMSAAVDMFDILGIGIFDKTDITLDSLPFYINIADPYSGASGFIKSKSLIKLYNEMSKKRITDLKDFFMASNKDMWFFETTDIIEKKLPGLLDERNNLRR